jgi:hypothetical protein
MERRLAPNAMRAVAAIAAGISALSAARHLPSDSRQTDLGHSSQMVIHVPSEDWGTTTILAARAILRTIVSLYHLRGLHA